MFTRNAIKLSAATMLGLALFGGGAVAQSGSIYQGILAEPNAKTQEVSTDDVRRILADGSAILIDPRKRAEYVAGHIAGAKNVAPEPGAPPAAFVAAIERLVGGDKSKPLVLYCNGQYCQASCTISDQLVAAVFDQCAALPTRHSDVARAQGPVEIELEGILRIYKIDQTALFFDARKAVDFAKVSSPRDAQCAGRPARDRGAAQGANAEQ